VLLQCYETFDDCMSGVPPASHFVGWSGTDNTQTVVNAFNDLMPAYGVLVDHAGTSPHWGGNECDHLPDGIYGDEHIVVEPDYEANGCNSHSWNECPGKLDETLDIVRALVPEANFQYHGRTRHHYWLMLEDCASHIEALNIALGLQPPSGALIEMTGDAPKLVFGTLESPVCELSLDRTNRKLKSTCPIESSGRRLDEIMASGRGHDDKVVGELEQLKGDIAMLKAQVAQLSHRSDDKA